MITRDNTLGELKAMPELTAFSDYIMVQSPEEAAALDKVTIGEACGERAYMIVDASNWLLKEASAGRVHPMDLWRKEEKAEDPEKERTGLLFFPAEAQPADGNCAAPAPARGAGRTDREEQEESSREPAPPKRHPYIIVCAGGAYVSVCNALEAFPAAQVLTKRGYHVFALTYRVASMPLLPKPQEDLAQAVRVIESKADELGVLTGDYAVLGFSAGAHLAGSFGTDNLGYPRFGVPKPLTLMLAYPATSAHAFDPDYPEGTAYINWMIGTQWTKELLDGASAECNMSAQYPPAFVTHSRDDGTVPFRSSELLVQRLEELRIPHRFKPVDGCDHGFSAGFGESEGWLEEACDFFEEQRDERFFAAERVNDHILRIQGACMEYMYLVEGSERAALIDTGTGIGDLHRFVRQLTEKPVTVLLSHGHMDHALGTPGFEEIYMDPKDDSVLAAHSEVGYRRMFIGAMSPALAAYVEEVPVPSYLPIRNGQEWDLGGVTIKAFECSGHTVGSVVFLLKEDRILFLGDACNSNTLVYDAAYSTTVEEYRDNLMHLQGQTEGLYDLTIFSHEREVKGNQLVPHMIALCNAVLGGVSDEEPVQFVGDWGLMAKSRGEGDLPKDGSDVNFMYRKERLYRPAGEAQTGAPGAAG